MATSTYPATSYHRSTGYTSSPNSGTYAYVLSNHTYGYLQSDFIPVSQAVEYDLYVWMRGEIDPEDSNGRWRVRAYFYDANNNLISGQNYAEVANGGEGSINLTWQLKGGRFTTPVSTAKVRIRLENGRNSGWIAFDDVVLNPVGGGNIAPNNGFESSGSWTEIRETKFPGTSFYRSNWGTAAGRNNSYAYVISNHAYGYLHNTTLISITANTQYDLYASVRGEIDPDDSESGGWIIRAYFYDSAGNPLSYINASSGGPGNLTTSWQNKGGRFTTPANSAKLQIQLFLYMSTGWVAYDNVDLKKVGTSTNLVTNPGFEDAAGWSEWRSSYYPGTSFLRATSGTAAPLSGLYAYAISNHSQGNLQSDSVSVAPNSDYDLYAFIRGELDPDDSHGAWRLRVNYHDSAGTYLTYQDAVSGNPGGLTAAWQYLGGRITTPANAASLKVRLYSYQTSGWIAIDDVSLTQKVSDAQTTNLTYDAENRLVEVKPGSTTIAAFTYDGDGRGLCTPEPRCGERGNRVKGVVDVPLAALGDAPLRSANITTVYIGNYFEWTHSTSTMKKYYYAGAQRVATLAPAASAGVRTGSSTLNWLLGDHLPSRGCSAALREVRHP